MSVQLYLFTEKTIKPLLLSAPNFWEFQYIAPLLYNYNSEPFIEVNTSNSYGLTTFMINFKIN